jgi:methyltransferase (TIGR00027 family)
LEEKKFMLLVGVKHGRAALGVRCARFSSEAALIAQCWHMDPLCVDPYAHVLAGGVPEALPHGAIQGIADVVAVRTRAVDAWLEKPSWPPVRTARRQIVLLGAGFDTRAYRLGLGQSTVLFEVDEDVLGRAHKRSVLASAGHKPRTAVVDVTASLTDTKACAAALLAAGFDTTVPTRWVIDGPPLLGGTNPPATGALFEMASNLGGTPASGLAAQILSPAWADHLRTLGMTAAQSAADGGLLPLEETLADAQRAGWREKRTLRRSDFGAIYGREPHESFALLFADADPDP